jgi:hypothetical protein
MQKEMTTSVAFDHAVAACRDTFMKKTADYGTSWRVYRPISIADQIYIKAKRIRTIQDKGNQRVGDDIKSEFEGILNYAIIGLIQLELPPDDPEQLSVEEVSKLYNLRAQECKDLMMDKNHDYGEAWREMSQEAFADLILSKVIRIKQIIGNEGKTLVSEGIAANFHDILNYSVFALILINEGLHSK